MTDSSDRSLMSWFNLRFDMVGFVAAIAALFVGVLLGWLWSPLFWIGAIASIVFLLAAKWNGRVPPGLPTAVVSPVDGIVTSITETEPPIELRMGVARAKRVRISSGPFSSNKLHAPITGRVETLIMDQGLQTMPFAFSPEPDGLMDAYVTFESRGQEVGLRVATGGLGPRLDFAIEAGDMMQLGKRIGTRRLGGWLDLYLPLECGVLVWKGQTLVAGETVLSRLSPMGDIQLERSSNDEMSEDIEAFLLSELGDKDALDVEVEVSNSTTGASDEAAGTIANNPTDTSDMFKRLRKIASEDTETDEN